MGVYSIHTIKIRTISGRIVAENAEFRVYAFWKMMQNSSCSLFLFLFSNKDTLDYLKMLLNHIDQGPGVK